MPQTQCSECEQKIDSNAKTCPHCNAILPTKISASTWLILAIIALVIGGPFFFVDSDSGRTLEEKATLLEQVEAENRRVGLEPKIGSQIGPE
ncbi:MAG: hypothetical protein ACI95C_001439 [Pseudohongiellaceae bacterium]|jgi:hypothetical protein